MKAFATTAITLFYLCSISGTDAGVKNHEKEPSLSSTTSYISNLDSASLSNKLRRDGSITTNSSSASRRLRRRSQSVPTNREGTISWNEAYGTNIFGSTRLLQQQCPAPDDCFADALGIDEDLPNAIAKWFGDSEDIVEFLIEAKAESESSCRSGNSITTNDDEPICGKLPLEDDTCYFSLYNEKSFLRLLAAKYIPFGDQIVATIESVEGFIGDIEGVVEDGIKEFYKSPDVGSCLVLKNGMIGIHEVPGFPAPWMYDFCNCISVKSPPNVPACTIQPYFRGFAIDVSDDTSLNYNPPNAFTYYDGNVEYSFPGGFQGDAWLGFALKFVVPEVPKDLTKLVCIPVPLIRSPTELSNILEVELSGSMFIKNDLNNGDDGELLVLGKIGDYDPITISLRGGFKIEIDAEINAALRVRSERPECFPSGLFFQARINPKMTFGALSSPILEFSSSDTQGDTEVSTGVTWKDRGDVEPEDYLQSIFLRAERTFVFLGESFTVEVEIQYFNDQEFTRRKNFDAVVCCEGGTQCDVSETSSLAEFLLDDENIQPQPTFAVYAELRGFNFYEIVKIEEVKLFVLFQIPKEENGVSLIIQFSAKVSALIFSAETLVIFAATENGAYASFEGTIEIDAGRVLGKAIITVKGRAEIGDYLNREQDAPLIVPNSDRDLQDVSFGDADWSLSVDVDYSPPQWLADIGKGIVNAVKFIANEIGEAWDEVTAFVQDSFDAIVSLGRELGDEISEIFDALASAVGEAGDELEGAIDSVASLFGDAGVGPIEDFLEGFSDIAGFAFDVFESGFSIGSDIFSGDFSNIDDTLEETFTSSKIIKINPSNAMGKLGCNKVYVVFKHCVGGLSIGGLNCYKKTEGPVEDIKCLQIKAKKINEMKTKAADAKLKQTCRQESQERNQGLKYINRADETSAVEGLNAKLSFEEVTLGTSSSMQGVTTLCKPLSFNLRVNTLSPSNANGFDGSRGNTGFKNTADCFDFLNKDVLIQTLPKFNQEKEPIINDAKSVVVGSQGLHNDESLTSCKASIDGLEDCVSPRVSEGQGFQTEASMTCGDGKPNLLSLFGQIDIEVDPRCQASPTQGFIMTGGSPPDGACQPRKVFYDRIIKGCCGDDVKISHVLNIEPTPPTITQPVGSKDVTKTCDANIHPDVFGDPIFQTSCAYASTSMSIEQSDPEFDLATCQTTIQRTFRLVESGCNANEQLFLQTITLENDYAPEFDFFPPDTTIGVFDEYGTGALGFPTAFQVCGLTVTITYTDMISEGKCFAERILHRTFKVVDICGHMTEKTQTITITNKQTAFPFGDLSLTSLFGKNGLEAPGKVIKKTSNKKPKSCLIPNDKCNINGAPEYVCRSATDSVNAQFSAYQSQLEGLPMVRMSPGVSVQACTCSSGDISCDKMKQQKEGAIYYGTKVTTSPGTCVVEEVVNPNHVGHIGRTEVDCPRIHSKIGRNHERGLEAEGNKSEKSYKNLYSKSTKETNSSKACYQKTLSGSNPVYNLFEISVIDFYDITFVLDVPSTSIALVNIAVPEEAFKKKIPLGRYSRGVHLHNTDLPAHNIIWNILDPTELELGKRIVKDWEFHGTILNLNGRMKLKSDKYNPVIWKGQIFAEDLKVDHHFEIQCGGHFSGFASCANMN